MHMYVLCTWAPLGEEIRQQQQNVYGMPESFAIRKKTTLHNRELINYVLFPEADSIDKSSNNIKDTLISLHDMFVLWH